VLECGCRAAPSSAGWFHPELLRPHAARELTLVRAPGRPPPRRAQPGPEVTRSTRGGDAVLPRKHRATLKWCTDDLSAAGAGAKHPVLARPSRP
jgi:hypothetical protein